MGKWPAVIDSAALYQMGPFLDGFVGTDGETSDLYDAIINKGWKRMFVTEGATLSADLTIATLDTWIYGTRANRGINLGARKITITGGRVYIRSIRLSGSPDVGFVIATGADNLLENCAAETATSHGFQISSANNVLLNCYARACGGDGAKAQAGGSNLRVNGGMFWGSTGYGINDAGGGSAIIAGARIAANTSGQVNAGANTVHANLNILV